MTYACDPSFDTDYPNTIVLCGVMMAVAPSDEGVSGNPTRKSGVAGNI